MEKEQLSFKTNQNIQGSLRTVCSQEMVYTKPTPWDTMERGGKDLCRVLELLCGILIQNWSCPSIQDSIFKGGNMVSDSIR